VHRFEASAVPVWDPRGFAGALALAVGQLAGEAAVVLMGREFGDFDDGSIPALLARELRLEHVSLTLGLERRCDALWASRQRGAELERVRLPRAALLSVANDSHNRLRHPLLKNVMAARKAQIAILPGASAGCGLALALAGMELFAPPPRASACRLLAGTPEQQADELARVLIDARKMV
jgi:electron transfer flavoprotein beta subunit